MKSRLYIILVFLFTFVSCDKKPQIEIYLTNHQIESSEGIPPQIVFNQNQIDNERLEMLIRDNVRYDTIKKRWVSSGRFQVKKENLKIVPLIKNDEILAFDLKNSVIYFSKTAQQKLSALPRKPKVGTAHQFAICIDGKPITCGYFRRVSMKSYWPTTYEILYSDMISASSISRDTFGYEFRFGKDFRMLDTVNENKLMIAFKESNRLKN